MDILEVDNTAVREQQIASSAGAGYDSTARGPSLFFLEATPSAGRTVQDYAIVVHQDYWGGSLFGVPGLTTENYFDWAARTNNFDFLGGYFSFTSPFDIATWAGSSTSRLYQESWAPSFGTFGGFDSSVEGEYTIRLSLVPKTFNGAPLSVTVRVVVARPQ